MRATKEYIEQIAREKWLKAGQPVNQDLDFWLQAEQEVQAVPNDLLYLPVCPKCKETKYTREIPDVFMVVRANQQFFCDNCKVYWNGCTIDFRPAGYRNW